MAQGKRLHELFYNEKVEGKGYKEWQEFIFSIVNDYCLPEDVRLRIKPLSAFPKYAQYFDKRVFQWSLPDISYRLGATEDRCNLWVVFRIANGKHPYFFVRGKRYRFKIDGQGLPQPDSVRYMPQVTRAKRKRGIRP